MFLNNGGIIGSSEYSHIKRFVIVGWLYLFLGRSSKSRNGPIVRVRIFPLMDKVVLWLMLLVFFSHLSSPFRKNLSGRWRTSITTIHCTTPKIVYPRRNPESLSGTVQSVDVGVAVVAACAEIAEVMVGMMPTVRSPQLRRVVLVANKRNSGIHPRRRRCGE